MRKRLTALCILLLCCFHSAFAAKVISDHLQALKSKHPYGVLTDDYGILTTNDLAINSCRFKPEPFPPKPFVSPYQYWQCFESKSISMSCDSSGVADEHEGVMGLVAVRASLKQVEHEYIERRPWPIRECRDFLGDLNALLKGTTYVCISGSFIENETDEAGGKTSWLFGRLKTNKGCEGRDCDFTQEMTEEN